MMDTYIYILPVINIIVNFLLLVIASVAIKIVNQHVKNKNSQELIDKAIVNALGYVTQVVDGLIDNSSWARIDVKKEAIAVAVKYVLEEVPDALKQLNISEEAIEKRVLSAIGLKFPGSLNIDGK